MKKLVAIMFAMGLALAAFAQPQGGFHNKGGRPDFEKIKAEKVAFITSEVGLTSKEAEAFWPVYNKIEEQQKVLNKAERDAYIALEKALAEGQSNVESLLDNYLKAKDANVNLHARNVKDYKKVLSADKLAKFFTCDEKFRRQQIGRLGGQGGHRGPMGGAGSKGRMGGGKHYRGDFQHRGNHSDKGSNGQSL